MANFVRISQIRLPETANLHFFAPKQHKSALSVLSRSYDAYKEGREVIDNWQEVVHRYLLWASILRARRYGPW